MTVQEAIEARHSVRAYKDQPLNEKIVKVLEDEIVKLNVEGQLHIQLICNEPKAFQGTLAKYGKFRNANNYLVMAGKKGGGLDERIGYYGEHLVLLAQTLPLLSYLTTRRSATTGGRLSESKECLTSPLSEYSPESLECSRITLSASLPFRHSIPTIY